MEEIIQKLQKQKKQKPVYNDRKAKLELFKASLETEEDIQLMRDSINERKFYEGINEAMLTDCEVIGLSGHCSDKCPILLKGKCQA